MCNKLLHWVELHVSALGIGRHQGVLRLIQQLYNRQGVLGEWGGEGRPPPLPLPPVYPAYYIVARQVKGQPDDGLYPRPKHVVVPNVVQGGSNMTGTVSGLITHK